MWSRSLLRWLKAQTGGMSTKKLLALLLTLAMALSLCACGGSDSGGGAQPAPAGASDGQAEDDPVQTQPVDTGALILNCDDLTETSKSWVRLDGGDFQLQIDHPSGFAFEGLWLARTTIASPC